MTVKSGDVMKPHCHYILSHKLMEKTPYKKHSAGTVAGTNKSYSNQCIYITIA